MTVTMRPEQVHALGGCAECKFEPVSNSSAPPPIPSSGPPPKSVVIVDPSLVDTFIGIELIDRNKKPVPYARYIVTPPGMSPIEGTLDVNGRTRIEGINPGTCTVVFPNIDRRDFLQR